MHYMTDMSERLRRARKAAGFKTMQDACEAHNLRYPTYAGHENGWREFPGEAAKYAHLFKVDLIWLMTGRGNMKPKSDKDPVLDLFESIPPERQGEAINFLAYLAGRKQ